MDNLQNEVADWFEELSAAFIKEHVKEIDIVKPRVDHMRRVASLCRSLAIELNWPEEDIATGEVIGYLHDIGRFSQYTEFHTFMDADSVDHTKRAIEEISNKGILDNCSQELRQTILNGIKYHNSRNFIDHVPKESVSFLRLIRDADKLEKYLTLATAFESGAMPSTLLIVDVDGPVHPSAVKSIRRNRKIPKKHIHSQLDYHLLQLSWIFEVTYPETIRHIITSRVIERILDILPPDTPLDEAVKHIKSYIKSIQK